MEIVRFNLIGDACVLVNEDPRMNGFKALFGDKSWQYICDYCSFYYDAKQHTTAKKLADGVIEHWFKWVKKVKNELQGAL